MPRRDGIHTEEEELPGVGMRDDFLTETEADILAQYLGTRRVVQRLSKVADAVEALSTQKVVVKAGSRVKKRTLEQSAITARTGAAVVAIWRGGEVLASPMPDFRLEVGDALILIGTGEASEATSNLIGGE